KVGYLSSDFLDHPVAFFALPLFTHHDRAEFEVVAYSTGARSDSTTQKLRSACDVWRDVPHLRDADLADLVRRDGLDLLTALAMHDGGRPLLFARKPAPIQLCWLAYAGTTGQRAIDYRVTDRHLDPPDAPSGPYAEASLYLPHCFWCYVPSEAPAVS